MKHILPALLSLLSLACFSQISFVHTGMPGSFSPSSVATLPDGGHISIKKEESKTTGKGWNAYRHIVTVFKYDNDFKLISQAKLAGGANIFSARYSEFRKINNHYWFIYLEGRDDDTMGDIKAMEINPVTLTTSEPKVVAASAALNHSISKGIKVYQLHFLSRSSSSGKYTSIYARLAGNEFYISCLDENLNRVWDKKETLEFGGTEAGTGLCSLEVTEDGTVYFGFTVKKGPGYYVYAPSGKSIAKTVALAEADAKEILFNADKNTGKVFAYGTYMEGDNCTGVYKAELNARGDLTSLSKTPFPASVVEPLRKEGWSSTKSKKYGIHPNFTAFLASMEDGSVSLLAELYMKIPASYTHAGSVTYARFGKSSTTFGRAPKYWAGMGYGQYTFDGDYDDRQGSFYYAYPYGSKMIIFYFDNPKNISRDISLDADVLKPSNQELVAAIVDADGNMTRQIVSPLPISYIIARGTSVQAGTIRIPLVVNGADVLVFVKTD